MFKPIEIEVTQRYELSEDAIISILEGAFSYSHYWCDMVISTEEEFSLTGTIVNDQGILLWILENERPGYESGKRNVSLIPGRMIKNGKILGTRGDVTVADCEVYTLWLHDLIEGIKLYARHVGKTVHTMSGTKRLDLEDIDAEEADLIIQFALFGEVLFG